MDGFFVAKIVKLSDRRPEDTLESAEAPEEEVAAAVTTKNKKQEGANSSINKKGKKDKKKRKGGPTDDEDGNDGNDNKEGKASKPKLSIPPAKVQPKAKKQKTNAKVTKPRRKRAATDA